MIIKEGDFKEFEQALQLLNTYTKAMKQRKTMFDDDYYEISSLTKKDIRVILTVFDKTFFADELGLTDDLTTEDLEKGW